MEVHHRLDSSCLDIHYYHTGIGDVVVILDVLSDSPVRNVLNVNIKTEPYVVSVLHRNRCAVRVENPCSLVHHSSPFDALLAVELVIEASFNSLCRAALVVVLHITDGSSGQLPIGIIPSVLRCDDYTSVILPSVRKRELL